MKRILIISNRLPLKIINTNNHIKIEPSVGGLATGMSSVHKQYESKWIGWPGIDIDDTDISVITEINQELERHKCIPVYLGEEDIENYYSGFSNKTIWPLYHYFTQYVEYNYKYWEYYVKVNHLFAEIVLENIQEGDIVWVHDYHLQLLPKLIKDARPDIQVGYFLHIPFPSFELFRGLPWRKEIIEGLLGADLVGFHTYDYERHFISSVRRLLGCDINLNQINLEDRMVKVDSFPMGIDYNRFYNSALSHSKEDKKDGSTIQKEINVHLLHTPGIKLVLSIDRLDYTKGIANRLLAFEYFLQKYPEFREKVVLVMLSVPSRSSVEQYQAMKSEVDELVGRINGEYSTVKWTPIWYFYRSLPFNNLIDLYSSSDIALITPIRDGMNLVAKEYIASRTDGTGVLILSEMAGAAKELGEATIINPNNNEEIAAAIKDAILMPVEEQTEKVAIMQKRLKRYDIEKWTREFLSSLTGVTELRKKYYAKNLSVDIELDVLKKYREADKKILFLDYDGTLVGFRKKPELASPDDELYKILDKLALQKNAEVVLISGRDKDTFTEWFGDKKYTLIVEHGVWIKEHGEDWQLIEMMNNEWKELIHPVIEFYVDSTPGSFIEEKNYSLVWHYRKCDPELGNIRAIELKDELTSLIANYGLEILEGNKVVEVKNSGINKGRAAMHKILEKKYNFILGIGDDWTDEYLFEALPNEAITIKVGLINTKAKYSVDSFNSVRSFLAKLADVKLN